MLSKLDPLAAWLLMILGAGHSLSAIYFFQPLVKPGSVGPEREAALHWVAGGGAFILVSFFNLLRTRYGSVAPGLLWACLVATVGALVFIALLVIVNPDFLTLVRVPALLLVLLLTGLSTSSLRARPD